MPCTCEPSLLPANHKLSTHQSAASWAGTKENAGEINTELAADTLRECALPI